MQQRQHHWWNTWEKVSHEHVAVYICTSHTVFVFTVGVRWCQFLACVLERDSLASWYSWKCTRKYSTTNISSCPESTVLSILSGDIYNRACICTTTLNTQDVPWLVHKVILAECEPKSFYFFLLIMYTYSSWETVVAWHLGGKWSFYFILVGLQLSSLLWTTNVLKWQLYHVPI